MYFPYLKLRSEEKRAIKETICQYNDNKIIPILEPFDRNEDRYYNNSNLKETVNALIENNVKFILLINSEDDLTSLKNEIQDLAHFDDFCIRGYYNDNRNLPTCLNKPSAIIYRTTARVDDSDNILYHIFMPAVLRFGSLVNDESFNNKRVKIEDGFICHRPNSDYPIVEDFNSELAFTYRNEGLAGFGDFTILEQGYEAAAGGNANLITSVMHLTKRKDNENKLEVYHYLTTPAMEPDNATRFAKTVAKAYNDRDRHFHSRGIALLEEIYPNSTSLAKIKRIGMIHHIEVIHSII